MRILEASDECKETETHIHTYIERGRGRES